MVQVSYGRFGGPGCRSDAFGSNQWTCVSEKEPMAIQKEMRASGAHVQLKASGE